MPSGVIGGMGEMLYTVSAAGAGFPVLVGDVRNPYERRVVLGRHFTVPRYFYFCNSLWNLAAGLSATNITYCSTFYNIFPLISLD